MADPNHNRTVREIINRPSSVLDVDPDPLPHRNQSPKMAEARQRGGQRGQPRPRGKVTLPPVSILKDDE